MYFNLQKIRLMNKIKKSMVSNLPRAIVKLPFTKPTARVSVPRPGGCGCSRRSRLK